MDMSFSGILSYCEDLVELNTSLWSEINQELNLEKNFKN